MSQPLPSGGFKWLPKDKWDEVNTVKKGMG